MGRSTHPWLSRARPGSAEPGSGSPGRIGFGPTDPIPIPGGSAEITASSVGGLAATIIRFPRLNPEPTELDIRIPFSTPQASELSPNTALHSTRRGLSCSGPVHRETSNRNIGKEGAR
ncbi:hypothetical protein Taro_026987 [Colocasia esculenta]|uniref:Uncharacterized protein n=1 Tax=Colocasia esculenta TaxID=4460 RepID=A0A843VQB7_COLES|nr:hypothetical protein [Colocasia esculenta]